MTSIEGKFTHLIITRFNLRKADWSRTKSQSQVLSDEWMCNRFELFTNYCLPGVVNQRNKNFTWLIYFDTTTPTVFREQIATLSNGGASFEPCFVDGMDAFLPSILARVQEIDTPYVITTRLDNDDSLHEDFVDEVQKQFEERDFVALDFVDGYALQVEPFVRLGHKRWGSNPFVSLVEKSSGAVSVWSRSHTDWKRETRLREITGVRIWLQVVHRNNKVNEFEAYGDVDAAAVLKSMHISRGEREKLLNKMEPLSTWRLFSFRSRINLFTTYWFKRFKALVGYYKAV